MKLRIVVLISIIFIFIAQNVSAYGIDTHAALTQEIFNFYNQHFSQNKLPEALKDYLLDGARREDDGHRSFNHFYDPIYDRGLNDSLYGKGYASKIWAQDAAKQNEITYRVVGTIASILTAFQQRKLSDISTESNYTWQKAIEYYVQGEPEKAMFALGHVLHLIEDASVPAHTRNDGHPEFLGDGDPYEVWAYLFNKDNIHSSVEKFVNGKQPIVFSSLDSYFNSMASYSNNNFYSGDTIGIQSGYDKPEPDYFKLENKVPFGIKIDNEFGDYHLIQASGVLAWSINTNQLLEFPSILNDSWSRLSTKAIQHGAGVINLFFQEVEKAKAEGKYQEKQKSFLGQLVDSVTGFVGNLFSGGQPDTVIPIGGQQSSFESQILDEQQNMQQEGSDSKPVQQCKFETNQTPSHKNLIINEVAWMGSKDSTNAEWIELRNISGQELDISGFQILDKSEQIQVTLPPNSIIYANNFYLLERDNDNTIPGIRADVIYKGPLSNTNEGLRLFDGNCNLTDEVFADSDWPAGNNTTKQTMERNLQLNWQTSVKVGGTPKQENSRPLVETPPEESEQEEISPIRPISPISPTSSTSSISQISPIGPISPISSCSFNTTKSPSRQNLIINEVAWMGTVNDANDEWVELRNISAKTLDISGYQLLDKAEQIRVTFENGTKIPAGGFYLLERTDDSIVPNITADKIYTGALANSNEGLRLFDSQCNLLDEALASPGWPAGDNSSKGTMERKNDFSWQTSTIQGGTPKAVNSIIIVSPSGSGGGGVNPSNQSSQPTSTPPIGPISPINHIVISEIYPDKTGSNYDFVEFYNPSDSVVDLSNYSLRILREEATSSESLAVFSNESTVQIPAKGFFLVGLDKYSESGFETADVFRSSKFLPSTQSAKIILQDGEIVVDEYQYNALGLIDGQSFERKAYSNNLCVSAQNDGEFLGNGCDNDDSADWEIRSSANPQNSQSLPEPREAPNAVTNFNLGYHFSAPALTMSWDDAVNSDVSYRVEEVNSLSSAPLNFNTTSTAAEQRIYEIGRRYDVSVKAVDAEGLASVATTANIEIPSFLNSVYFYKHPDPTNNLYLVDFYYDSRPFIPLLYEPDLFSRLMVAYLNGDNVSPPPTIRYEDYGSFPIPRNLPDAVSLRYLRCNNSNIDDRFRDSASVIVLPVSGLGGCSFGWNNDFLNPTQFEDEGHLQLALAPSAVEISFSSSTDFLNFAFYAPYPWSWSGAGGRIYELVAVDKTKYYFQSVVPALLPPDPPADLAFNFSSDELEISFLPATDRDTLDYLLTYRMKIDGGEWQDIVLEGGDNPTRRYIRIPADYNTTYAVSLAAVDEFGNLSELATAPYTTPSAPVPPTPPPNLVIDQPIRTTAQSASTESAQNFIASIDFVLKTVRLYAFNSSEVAQTVTMKIYQTDGEIPTTVIGETTSVLPVTSCRRDDGTCDIEVGFNFSPAVNLNANTYYAFSIQNDAWGGAACNNCYSGTFFVLVGGRWQTGPNLDFKFQIFKE